MAGYFKDQYLVYMIKEIAKGFRMYDFFNDCNQQGLEIDKYLNDIALERIETEKKIKELIEHIFKNYNRELKEVDWKDYD